ncbi:MAG: PfkB family carbohydrate kinase [Thiohalocapsa sp.]
MILTRRRTNPDASRVLGVGIATLDIVNLVTEYPREDAEVRASSRWVLRGGNVANTLAVLRQFGRACDWAGTLADDADAALIRADLDRRGIGRSCAVSVTGSRTPTSYIALSGASRSRTIIHFRDLREFTARDFETVSLSDLDWVHFEGRNPVETAEMIARVRRERNDLPVSVEIEKPRDGIERLFDEPDVLVFSRVFAEETSSPGIDCDPRRFLRECVAASQAELCVLPWGADGAYGIWGEGGGEIVFAPAHAPAVLADTLAAGDVFNAALIDGLLHGLALPALLARANRIAGHKCGRHGLDGLVDSALHTGLLG